MLRFKCWACRRPVDPDDEVLLGELPMHQNCVQCFDARHGGEIERIAYPHSIASSTTGGGFDPFNA